MYKNRGKIDEYKEIQKFGINNYRVMWDKQPIMVGNDEDPDYVTWMEENFIDTKPDIEHIKDMVLNSINESVDFEIANGFKWTAPDGRLINVYLSSENQFNYKAAYDLAYQTNGQSLPFILKFGSVDNPQYYRFDDLETFRDFYTSCITFINTVLSIGWNRKDSIDWTRYEIEEEEIS